MLTQSVSTLNKHALLISVYILGFPTHFDCGMFMHFFMKRPIQKISSALKSWYRADVNKRDAMFLT